MSSYVSSQDYFLVLKVRKYLYSLLRTSRAPSDKVSKTNFELQFYFVYAFRWFIYYPTFKRQIVTYMKNVFHKPDFSIH